MLGVTHGGTYGVEFRIALCRGDALVSLRLEELTPESPGESLPDTVLWRIEAEPPVAVESVVAGEVPPGFREVAPWTAGSLRSDRALAVTIRTTRFGSALQVFRLPDVPRDQVLTAVAPGRTEVLSDAAFRTKAAEVC